MDKTVNKPRRRKLRIMLVEDEKMLSELCELLIRELFKDVELLLFEDGDAAWQYLLRSKPDLLITDLYHPGMDGGTMIRRLADRQVKFPIIFTTAEPNLSQDYTALGIQVVLLPKPCQIGDFCHAVTDLTQPSDRPNGLFPGQH
jgi:two-component system, OmpR family, response regulator